MMGRVFDLLFGCPHKHLSRPVTPSKQAAGARVTYVVCLDCGKEFAYDWDGMRIGRPMTKRQIQPVTLPSTTAALAPVAEGRFEGLRRHV